MKISFKTDVLPHALAVLLFFLITVTFFSPVFFENKALNQHDIQQHIGSSKALRDYRDATGEEGLWAGAMFSGMPAYLVNLQWSDGVVVTMKKVLSMFLPHPVANIFLAFIGYYILLLVFRIRPYLAIVGAIAFGLSSFMIVGLMAGHNARIGAIAFMPLVLAGIHLAFTGRRVLGFGVTAGALALHLRENHLQITYYLVMIVAGYGLMQLILAVKAKQLSEFFKTLGMLVPAALIAAGTFFGQFWAISEYKRYSIRGPSELVAEQKAPNSDGLSKDYVFEFSNAIDEPMTLLIPDFLGGSTSNFLFYDEQSESYKALVNSGSNEVVNQLGGFTSAYWGPQRLAVPYYAGAIMCVLFVVGILFAEKKYVWWLLSLSVLSIALSWGSNFSSLNYFVFDYFPGYSMFRSVTFALVIILVAMPLLGLLGLERFLHLGWNKSTQKKALWAVAVIPGICLLVALTGGFGSFLKPGDMELPAWFRTALRNDRLALLRSDAWRSFWFAFVFAAVLFATSRKWIKEYILVLSLVILVLIDMPTVDKRYLTKDSYQRKRSATFPMSTASQQVLTDDSYYRVYNLQGTMSEAETSYYHNSIGGYHGAKLRRYQDLYDSCITGETQEMISDLRESKLDFSKYGVLNMLNVKYIMYGDDVSNIIPNQRANGPAWFVQEVQLVNSPTEELKWVGEVDTKRVAVIDGSKFKLETTPAFDSTSTVKLMEQKPATMKYEANSAGGGLIVFSEIYYPKGWRAFVDGKEVPLLRANYVLRAVDVPAGTHAIEMRFAPKPYLVGNMVTMASSWILLVLVAGCLGFSAGVKQEV